ncbi:MAG: heparinase II/III family protein [Clostridia bacterium]|nr:heparinase II/III family protein [Clostridia bacterium]
MAMKKLSKFKKTVLGVFISIVLVVALGITNIVPYFAVIPDMVKVGVNYITLDRNTDYPDKKDLSEAIVSKGNSVNHPFVLADVNDFSKVREEYKTKNFSEYTEKLTSYVLANADGLLDMKTYPPRDYVLDEEDSILPISREVINRMIILGYAWQLTGEEKYAERAVAELQKVCSYNDWCNSHFLASSEMAFAVSIGYDWFYDYLDSEVRELLAEKTWNYAIYSALNDNHWFTWSKNNWNSICYSGIGIACMTFSEYDTESAAEFLSMCYKNMPIAFENFTPDGVYAEGPGYSQSGMNAIVNFIATSDNFFGTDYGLKNIDGFRELGSFPAYITTPTGVFNFGDNKARLCFSPSLHRYADEYDSPLLSCYQMQDIPDGFIADLSDNTEKNSCGKDAALSLLWYNREFFADGSDFSGEETELYLKSDVGQDLVLMRSAYLDENATFAGIKGGYNFINHGDLDIGTFVFDSQGVRWAEELGPGQYDAPGYFVNTPAGGRWKNYSKRAEGQNTLVINPSVMLEDQYVLAESEFILFEKNSDGGRCVLDMTDAYRMNGAIKAEREFELYNNHSSLRITDKVNCIVKSDIYWFMHTKADIRISEDGKTAVLTIGDKQLRATSHFDGTFSVMKAEALKGPYDYDEKYEDINKLTVKLEKCKNAEIVITLEPVIK